MVGFEESTPTSSPGDCLRSGENTGTFCPWVEKTWLGWVLQPGLFLPGTGRPLLRPGPPESHCVLCLLYWFCWLGERELGPGLGGSELALGARGA